MRIREEIQSDAMENIKRAGNLYPHGAAILEVLLDIRDLLTKKEDNNN